MLKLRKLFLSCNPQKHVYSSHDCKFTPIAVRMCGPKQFSSRTSLRIIPPISGPGFQNMQFQNNVYTTLPFNVEIDYQQHLAKVKEGLKVVDVRNPDEIEKNGRVAGALEIPLPVLKTEFALSADEWKQKYNGPKPESEENIMVICASGVRSRKGVRVLKDLGYKHLFSYKGGYTNFKEQK